MPKHRWEEIWIVSCRKISRNFPKSIILFSFVSRLSASITRGENIQFENLNTEVYLGHKSSGPWQALYWPRVSEWWNRSFCLCREQKIDARKCPNYKTNEGTEVVSKMERTLIKSKLSIKKYNKYCICIMFILKASYLVTYASSFLGIFQPWLRKVSFSYLERTHCCFTGLIISEITRI